MKDYFSDEDEKCAPVPPPFQLSKYEKIDEEDSRRDQSYIEDVKFSGPDSERGYSDAFLALKEPEHPITFDDAKKMRDEKEERETQTEILTEYILSLLMEQIKMNMFPKRVIIPMKSPSKEDSYLNNESQNISNAVDNDHQIVDEDLSKPTDSNSDNLLLTSL